MKVKSDPQMLLAMDRRWAMLGIDLARAETLRGEIDRLADAMEAVRDRVDFDAESAAFRRALEEQERKPRHD